MDRIVWLGTIPCMGRNFIRAWRKHRRYSQERLAEAIGMSAANLSRIETGAQPYTQGNLESIAAELTCTPVDLLARDPEDDTVDLYDTIRVLEGEDRRALRHFVKTMLERKRSA